MKNDFNFKNSLLNRSVPLINMSKSFILLKLPNDTLRFIITKLRMWNSTFKNIQVLESNETTSFYLIMK
jgi:hypothetical protein